MAGSAVSMTRESPLWSLSWRADPRARALADRHYNRQHHGAKQFVPPGRCLVQEHEAAAGPSALWITSWPFAAYVRHAWAGAWVCSAFRREAGALASDLVREAVAATAWAARSVWRADAPAVPSIAGPVAMVTFVDPAHVRPKRDLGRCYRRAGFVEIGTTAGGLLALGLPAAALPEARVPRGACLDLEIALSRRTDG